MDIVTKDLNAQSSDESVEEDRRYELIKELQERIKVEKNPENIEEMEICIRLIEKDVFCEAITKEEEEAEQVDFYFAHKKPVNDEWEQKKKLYGFTDDIKNTKLYQLNCEIDDDDDTFE